MVLRTKNLEKLLRATFQEQGEKIVPPSSQKLWVELKQRPEFVQLWEIEVKIAAARRGESDENKGSARIDFAAFWRKYRHLTGLAAACFLLVVLFARFIPISGFMEDFFGKRAPFDRGESPQMEISLQSIEEAESSSLPEEAPQRSLKSFPLNAPFNSEEALQPSTWEGLSEKPPAQSEFRATSEGEGKEAEAGFFAAEADMASGAESSETEELIFTEEASFKLALEEIKPLASEGIWKIKYLPGEYEFTEGKIVKTKGSVLNVQQKFQDPKGRIFTLVQEFFQTGKTYGKIVTTADSLEQHIQVGPYFGYLKRPQPGVHTLIWLQEKSVVTLSGELMEEQLYQILASMSF